MRGSLNPESSMPIPSSVCASDPRQEPGAVVPLAGICAGGGPQGPFLPRTRLFAWRNEIRPEAMTKPWSFFSESYPNSTWFSRVI
jgi:hypothetical protein